MNGRPFNLCDAEHYLCKAYIAAEYARGTRAYNSHYLARPHCHPTRSLNLHHSTLTEIFGQTLTVYRQMVKHGHFPRIPKIFQLYHERDGNGDAPGNDEREDDNSTLEVSKMKGKDNELDSDDENMYNYVMGKTDSYVVRQFGVKKRTIQNMHGGQKSKRQKLG